MIRTFVNLDFSENILIQCLNFQCSQVHRFSKLLIDYTKELEHFTTNNEVIVSFTLLPLANGRSIVLPRCKQCKSVMPLIGWTTDANAQSIINQIKVAMKTSSPRGAHSYSMDLTAAENDKDLNKIIQTVKVYMDARIDEFLKSLEITNPEKLESMQTYHPEEFLDQIFTPEEVKLYVHLNIPRPNSPFEDILNFLKGKLSPDSDMIIEDPDTEDEQITHLKGPENDTFIDPIEGITDHMFGQSSNSNSSNRSKQLTDEEFHKLKKELVLKRIAADKHNFPICAENLETLHVTSTSEVLQDINFFGVYN